MPLCLIIILTNECAAFVQANPPESMQTDISLSQFLAIQEKGVSAWEFEPELEIANCFVEGRTEIEFFDSECSVQSNLPIPKQNEVYYWEAKIYDKPESTLISIGMTTKPYPLFRMPGSLLSDNSIHWSGSNNRQDGTNSPLHTHHWALGDTTSPLSPRIMHHLMSREMLSVLATDHGLAPCSSHGTARNWMTWHMDSRHKISFPRSAQTVHATFM